MATSLRARTARALTWAASTALVAVALAFHPADAATVRSPAAERPNPRQVAAPAKTKATTTGAARTTRAAGTAASTIPVVRGRSAWVWTRPDPAELASFAAEHGLRRQYVHVTPKPDAAERGWLSSVRAATSPGGVQLWALGGDPAWATRSTDALTWQKAALATGVFAGAHVDVEPYALPGWGTTAGQAALVKGHLAMLTDLQKASPLPLEADLPFWAGQIPAGGGRTWADGVLARVNLVTAMTYRDSATGILEAGADLLARGDASGTPVQLAAETDPLPDCPKCTFAEEGPDALMAAVEAVEAAASSHRSFAGMSIHRYAVWRSMTS